MSDISNTCRFCLQEETSDSDNKVFNVKEYPDKFLYEKITNCTGQSFTSEDVIPPLVCQECIHTIEKFSRFLENIRRSERVLRSIYTVNTVENLIEPDGNKINSSEELVENSKAESECDNNADEFVDCQSGSSYEQLCGNTDQIAKSTSLSPHAQENEVLVCLSEENKVDIYMDERPEKNKIQSFYVCSICPEIFDSFFEYQDHQLNHNGNFVFACSKCDEIFSHREMLVEHEQNHKVLCDECDLPVLPKSLEAHMRKHTDRHKCTSCDSRHTSRASLETHIKARHAGIKGFVCHICGKQNSCQSSMKRHLASHSSERPYNCDYCSFATKSKATLKMHILRKHFAEKCACKICEKPFKSMLSMKQHLKRIHNPKKHKCDVCLKAFAEKFNLDKHFQKKHSKQRIYECRVCHVEYFTIKQLKQHMHSHRKGCVNCPNCGKEFFYKKFLERHLLKYSCEKSQVKYSVSMPDATITLHK